MDKARIEKQRQKSSWYGISYFYHGLAFVLFLISLLFSCQKINEIEPNDSPQRATQFRISEKDLVKIKPELDIPEMNFHTGSEPKNISDHSQEKSDNEKLYKGKIIELKGTFKNQDDRDCYNFQTPKGFFYLKLGAIKGINGAIELYHPKSGNLIKVIDDQRKSDEEVMPFQPAWGNTVICFVQGARDRKKDAPNIIYHAEFVFVQLTLDADTEFETEPNDAMETATLLSPNKIMLGSYSPALNILNKTEDNFYREEDWYLVKNNSGDMRLLSFRLELGPVRGADPVLLVYNLSGERLLAFDNRLIHEGESTSFLRLLPGEGYYIRIYSKVILSIPNSFYSLRMIFGSEDDTNELEPNNSPLSANTLKGQLKGYLSYKGDEDYFRFSAEHNKSIFIGKIIFPKSLKSPFFEIQDMNRQILAEVRGDNHSVAQLAGLVLLKGNYFLKIADSFKSFDEKNPYEINIHLKKQKDLGEEEPNDDLEHATVFNWGPEKNRIGPGYLSPETDADIFQIKLSGNERKRFRFELDSKLDCDIYFSITDQQGYALKKALKPSGQELILEETIDGRGYLILKIAKIINYKFDQPYFIFVRELKN